MNSNISGMSDVSIDSTSVESAKNNINSEKLASKNDNSSNNKQFKAENVRPSYLRNTKDPDVFYGKGFDGDHTRIKDIQDEIGQVIVRGKILNIDTMDIRNEKTIVMFSMTDFTDSIRGKVFIKTDEVPILLKSIKKGNYMRLKCYSPL